MRAERARKLERTGWRVGSARDFLGLSDEEVRLLKVRSSLIDAVRSARARSGISQVELAVRMKSSQSRVAKIEAGDPSVSMDLIVKALIAAGASDGEIAKAISGRAAARPARS